MLMPIDSKKAISLFAFIIFLTGVSLFAYLGIYNRYWADDWCYNADLRELGFIDTLKGYTYITTYAANRYALTFFSGLFYYLGIFGVQIMTLLNITALALGLYWCLVNIKKISGVAIANSSLAIFTLITIYYSIYLAPHLYQSVYWRSGSLPYFQPLVLGVFVFALITLQGVRARPSSGLTIAIVPLSFLAGGFSEAACVTLTTMLAFYLGATWFFRTQAWAKRSFPIAAVALVSTLISMVVLISSPTTAHRVGLYGEPASLVELPVLILRYSFDFVKFSFKDLPLPHLAIMVTSFLLGYLLHDHDEKPVQTRTVLTIIFFISVMTFIVIASSFAPSAYIEKVPPHPRTRIIPRFVLTLALVFISWLPGALAGYMERSKRFYSVAVILFALVAIYSVRSIFIAGQNIPIYAERARLWDERERQIETSFSNGEASIVVGAIDGLPVGGIRDLEAKGQGKPGYWINICAARFYDVQEINIR
jgi:hypothetical protein